MSVLKGKLQHKKWQEGKSLTRKEAMLAMCYECNGLEDSNEDCCGEESCPMYQYAPYKGKKSKLKAEE